MITRSINYAKDLLRFAQITLWVYYVLILVATYLAWHFQLWMVLLLNLIPIACIIGTKAKIAEVRKVIEDNSYG